ncbi:MAG: hypothetical protein LBF12_06405 [Christensenellaceae bacterium]|jgi:hypothetical protein|nr:hypothetical protein [Christensenellaceae bacterium]
MKKSNHIANENLFAESFHKSGRIFTLICLILISLMPVIYCISAGVMPIWENILKAMPFMLSYILIAMVEIFSYAPLLSVGGQYMAYITGNISNLKLPCAINAQTITKTKRGTEEQEIITTIAISVSSIVTTIIITIGLIPLSIFGKDIVDTLKPVTPYVIPAIFGGLGIVLLSRYFKLTIVPFGIMLLIALAMFLMGKDYGQSTMLSAGMVVSLVSAFILYKRDSKKLKITQEKREELYNEDEDDLIAD